jgi:hypothetical protein
MVYVLGFEHNVFEMAPYKHISPEVASKSQVTIEQAKGGVIPISIAEAAR